MPDQDPLLPYSSLPYNDYDPYHPGVPSREQASADPHVSYANIFNNVMQQVKGPDNPNPIPIWTDTRYTPWDEASRYMTGLGHSGYTGPSTSEDFNARNQSWATQGLNGILKGVAIAGTSFIDGTAGLLTGTSEAIYNKDFSKLFNNEVSNSMQDTRDSTERSLPNYYTDKEQAAPLWSPDYWFHMNFLSDKIIKNLGWAAAAMGESFAIGKLAGNLARKVVFNAADDIVKDLEASVSAVQNGTVKSEEAQSFLKNKLTSYLSKPVDGMGELGSIESRYGSLYENVHKGIERFSNVLATSTEANSEALQGYKDIKKDMLQQYRDEHSGQDPDQKAMEGIEARAKQGSTVRFWANVGLLSVTNNIELPRLLNGSLKFEKNTLGKETHDIIVKGAEHEVAQTGEEYAAKQATRPQKIATALWNATGVVANTEALEEGLQYAVETGTHDYEMRSKDPRALEAVSSIFTNGLPKMISTREGWENMLIGGLSGKLMARVLEGGDHSRQHTNELLKTLNEGPQAGAFVAAYDAKKNSFTQELSSSVVRGVSLLMDKKEAVEQGDTFTAQNLEADLLHNYVLPRVKFGRFDLLQNELNQYKDRPIEEVKNELGLPEDTTKEAVNERVDSLLQKATMIKGLYGKMAMAYGLQHETVDGKRVQKYHDAAIERMAYLAYRTWDTERRSAKLSGDIETALSTLDSPLSVNALFDKRLRKKSGAEETLDLEEVRNVLSKHLNKVRPENFIDSVGINLDEKLRDIERLQNQKEAFLSDLETTKERREPLKDLDLHTATEDAYKQYEREHGRLQAISSLQRNTELRPYVNELERSIREGKAKGQELTQVLSAARQKNAFLWDHMRPQIMELINHELEAHNRLSSEHQLLAGQQQRMEDLLNRHLDHTTGLPWGEQLSDEEAEEMEKLGQEEKTRNIRIAELEGQLDQEKINSDALVKMRDSLGAGLEQIAAEPKELSIGQRSRKVADSFLSAYHEIENNVKQVAAFDKDKNISDLGEYGDEKTLADIDSLTRNIDALHRIFSSRKDISFKKGAFKNYLRELEENKRFLQQVHAAIEKRLSDREAIQKRSEATFTTGLGLGFGYDISTDEITHPDLYEAVRAAIGEKEFDSQLAKIKKEKRMELVHELYDMLKARLSKDGIKKLLTLLDSVGERVLKEQGALVDKVGSHELNRYSPLAANYRLNPGLFFPRLLLHLTGNEESLKPSAYKNYSWHKNHLQLWQDTTQEIASGKADELAAYEKIISKEDRIRLLRKQSVSTGIAQLQQALRSDKSFFDIYSKLRLLVADANKKGENVPTTQQLISVIGGINFYFSANGKELFDNWNYLEGVIGAGKTSIFTKYVLDGIAEITGRDISDMVHATADTKEASATINQSLGFSDKPDIAETIQALKDNAFNKELIVLDEAARPSAEQIAALAKAVQEYNKRSDKSVKVLAIGDTNQIINASVPGIERSEGLSSLMPFSISYRSNVAAIADVQAVYRSAGGKKVDGLTSSGTVASIPEGAGTAVYGVYGSKNEQDIISALASRPDTINGKPLTKAVIVNKGQEAFWRSKLKDINNVRVTDYYNAQGKTFDEVYMWLKEDPQDHLLKNQADLNNVIYTNLRGRNLVFIGGTDVHTIVKPSVQEGIERNQQQNRERGKQLYDKLDHAVKEFETLSPELPQEPSSATDSTIADNDRIGQQLIQHSREELTDLLQDGITGTSQMSDDTDEDTNSENSPEIEDGLLRETNATEKVDDNGNALPQLAQAETTAPVHELAHPTSDNLKADKLQGNKIMVMAVPNNNGGLKFSVVQATEVPGQFRELAVLGEKNGELQRLGLADKHALLNNKYVDDSNFKENANRSFVSNKKLIEIVPVGNRSVDDLIKPYIVSTGNIINAAPLNYSYDHKKNIKDTIFTANNKLLDFIKNRAKAVFNTDKIEKTDKGSIIMGTDKNVDKYNDNSKDKKSKNSLLQRSKPHVIIKISDKTYQAVELSGRILNYDQPIHYTIYGDPVVSFFDRVDAFNELAKLDNFFVAHSHLLTDAGSTVNDFKPGTPYWNKLVVMLADGNYKHALADEKAVSRPQATLYNSVIEHLKASGNIDRILELAGDMDRLAYKRDYEKNYTIKDSEGNVLRSFPYMGEAKKFSEGHEGSMVHEEYPSHEDDLGKVRLKQKKRNASGRAQLAVEHLMKANPVIPTGTKTLFPVFTRSWKEGEKDIRQFRVRNILHHKINSAETGAGHRAFLENYILNKTGVSAHMGIKDKVNSKQLNGLRRKLSEIYNRLNDIGTIPHLDFDTIITGLRQRFTASGSNMLGRLISYGSEAHIDTKKLDAYIELSSRSEEEQEQHTDEIEKLYQYVKGLVSGVFDNDPANIEKYYGYWQQVENERSNYQTQLTHDDIRNLLHPDQAINEQGESKLGLRINIPIMWKFVGKDNFAQVRYDMHSRKSTQELVHLSEEEQLHQMLTTRLTAIKPASLSVSLDNGNTEKNAATENKKPLRAGRKAMRTEESIPDGTDFAALKKGKGAIAGTRTIYHVDALSYIRRFLPGIQAADIQVLDRLQMLRQFGKELFGSFMNGVIYLEKNDKGNIYEEAIRHEVFHSIFRQYLTTAERNVLLTAGRQQYGMPAASANDIEEKLASEFQKRTTYELLAPIINFFRHIARMFRFIAGRKNLIEDLFDKIDRGNFRAMSRDNVIAMSFAPLARVQKVFNNDPFVIRRAKDYVQQQFAAFSYLSKNDLDPHTDWEIKDEIISDLKVLKETHEIRLDNSRSLDPAQREHTLSQWNSLSPKEQYSIINKWDAGTDHPLYDNVWTTDDQHMLAAVNGLLQTKDGQYYALNELIKGLKPEIKISSLESNEELSPEETEVANLQSLFEKDDSVDIRSKMTGDLKLFLSSIFRINRNGVPQFVRMEQALYYVYENVSALNGGSPADFKNNLQLAFERTGISSWQKQLTLKAILKIAEMANAGSNFYNIIYHDSEGGQSIVGINNNVGFRSENRFFYKGMNIDRTMSGKKETTTAYFNRIIDILKAEEDKGAALFHNDDVLTVDDFSNEDLHLILKSYWQRDMSNRVLQDLINLADSLYFTNPYTGVYEQKGGDTTYATFSLQPDKDKPLMKSNIVDGLWQKVSKGDTYKLEQIKDRLQTLRHDHERYRESKEDIDTILSDFFDTIGMIRNDDRSFPVTVDPENSFRIHDALYQVCASVLDIRSEERFNTFINNMQGYINTIAKVASYNGQAEKTITSYIRSDGKKQFFQRYMAFANKILLKVLRKEGKRGRSNRWKMDMDVYLSTPFFKHNIFNPLGHYYNGIDHEINGILDHTLDDAVSEDGNPASAVLYDQQSPKDYLSRVFLVHFGGSINGNRSTSEALTYKQNFYTTSDKSTNTNAEVFILKHSLDINDSGIGHSSRKGTLGSAIWAAVLQELNRPDPTILNLKNYTAKDQTKSLLPGLQTEEADKLREALGQKLNTGEQDLHENPEAKTLVKMVYDAMEKDADASLNAIMKMNEQARYGDRSISKDKAIVFDTNMEQQYEKLLNREILRPNDLSKEHFIIKENNHSFRVEMKGYDPNLWNWNVATEHIAPMWRLFYANNYMNGLFLNQLVAGDQAMFKHSIDQVKRMAGPFAVGMSPLQIDAQDSDTRWPNTRRMNKNYRVAVTPDLFLIRRADAPTEYVFHTEKEAAKLLQPGDSLINATDAAGIMSSRRYEQTKKGYGPGLQLQANQKPVHWEITANGVPRYLKYATFALTDEVCRKFPQYLTMRVRMETYGMEQTQAREAAQLIIKQVKKGLLPDEEQRLETLFKTNEHSYIDEMIHESGVKTGLPATLSGYNEQNDSFYFDDKSILELSNENWRIQLNPSADIDSHVSLFTQLLYYAGFDKANIAASTGIYNSLAKWFDLRLNKVLGDVGVKDLQELTTTQPEKIIKAVKSMIVDRIANTPGKERLWEYLNEGVSLDAPFIANDVSTQLSAIFNKGVIQVKFPGSKFQLISPEMTDHFEGREQAMPKYDAGSNTMEVYLPNIWKDHLPQDMKNLSDEQVQELNLMLGFRIPSTGLNSSARIKVIGFWPSEQNVVVAPADINRQMGSDYDVDSLFLARPEILSDAERQYISRLGVADHQAAGFKNRSRIEGMEDALNKYRDERQTRQILEKVYANQIVYAYLDMLSEKHNLEDIQRPTDFELLKSPDGIFSYVAASINKEFADKLDDLRSDPEKLDKEREKILAPKEDINNIWNNMKMYLANRSGKALVGITANTAKTFAYLAYQSMKQEKPVLYTKPFVYNGHTFDRIGYQTDEQSRSLYNQDGKKLSEVFSILINAAVDNAKEQILSVINMSTANANAFLTLVGSGLSLKSVVTIMRQPLIRDLSDLARINSYAIEDKRTYLRDQLGISKQQQNEMVAGTELSDELIRHYLAYESMNDAESKLEGDELKQCYAHQLATLDLFEKAQDIGQAAFSMSRALGIIQNNQPSVEDMQNVMDEIFRLYKMKGSKTPDSKDGYFQYKTYEINEDDKHGKFREDFPLKNVDLLQIPHWKAAFKQLQALYQLNKKALFRHSDLMQRLSQNLEKSFDLTLDKKANRNRALIRAEIVKAVLSGLQFSYQGRQVDFSTVKQAPYVLKNAKGAVNKIYYRNDAFIQSFIQKVRSYKNAYPDNPFLRLLRIDNDWQSGLSKLSVKDVSGIVTEYEELKIIENGFKSIDAQERKKYEGKYAEHWYSDLQFDFVKYLALTQGLRFGSYSYAWLLPADIYSTAIKALDNSFDNMKHTGLNYVKTTPEYQSANEKEREEMEGRAKTDEGSYNVLKDHISDLLALQIAKNNSQELSKLRYGRNEINASLKLRSDKEGNFYNLVVKPSEKDKATTKLKSVSEDTQETEAALDLDNGGEVLPEHEQVEFFERMPVIIRHNFSTGTQEHPSKTAYVLVKTGQDKEGNVLYQLIGKASNSATYQFDNGLLAPAMHNYYTIAAFFNGKTYYANEENITEQSGQLVLSSPVALKPEQSVMSLKKGDELRLAADRYRVAEEVQKGTDKAQAIGKKIAALIKQKNELNISAAEVDSLQRKIDRLAEQLRHGGTGKQEQEFTAAQKEFASKSASLADKQTLQEQIDELQEQRKEEMYVYRLDKIADGFSPVEKNMAVSDLQATPEDMDKGSEDQVSCMPPL